MKDKSDLISNISEALDLYKKVFPPGTVSKCGNFVMKEDGLWWGRCVAIPEVTNREEKV